MGKLATEMIIIKIQGGLGNQLFQYAFGRALSIERREKLLLDTSYYRSQNKRRYLLDNFNIAAREASILEKFFYKLFLPNKYKVGYFQSEKYFTKSGHTIKEDLILKSEQNATFNELASMIASCNSVSLHIRRGDYVTAKYSKIYASLPLSYYKKAIKHIQKTYPDIKIFVFSDDPDWTKDNLKLTQPHQYVFDNKFTGPEDLILMSRCKHNIIANSTFSWWAAWLNKNPGKVIISPEKWFVDNRDEKNIIPEQWIKI